MIRMLAGGLEAGLPTCLVREIVGFLQYIYDPMGLLRQLSVLLKSWSFRIIRDRVMG